MSASNSVNHTHNFKDFKTTIKEETLAHLPYAIFSIAFGMIVLSFVYYFAMGSGFVNSSTYSSSSMVLFHSFHFLHIIFAATGTMITYLRYSHRIVRGVIIGLLSTSIFCALSDVVLPYIGSRMLGVPVDLHFCIISEFQNFVPFLIIGILNGILLSKYHAKGLGSFSVGSHFSHILISSFASLFYLFANGFTAWQEYIGPLFIFLIFAVVLPCTLSDVVVPLYFARVKK